MPRSIEARALVLLASLAACGGSSTQGDAAGIDANPASDAADSSLPDAGLVDVGPASAWDAGPAPWPGPPCGTSPGARPCKFSLTDLGMGIGRSIDEDGRVTGVRLLRPNTRGEGSVYTPGSGWSAVPVPEGATAVEVIGIDVRGRVAANAWFPFAGIRNPEFSRAFIGSPLEPLPTQSAGTDLNPPISFINAMHPRTGHAVGYDQALGGAFFYDGVMVTPIAVSPGHDYMNGGPSQAMALNGHDQVVGWMRPVATPHNSSTAHAFFWDRNNGIPIDLGVLRGCNSEAVGINDAGVVAGMIDGVTGTCGEPKMFLWDGTMQIIGCPDGATNCSPQAINASGTVVGRALKAVGAPVRTFIYQGGVFQFLDEITESIDGVDLDEAPAINDRGQIVAHGLVGRENHVYLLTPR